MARRLDITFICGAGLGSSLACQMESEEVLRAAGVDARLHHDGISAVASVRTDIIVSAENFRSQIEKYELDPAIDVVYLRNIVDKGEIAERLLPVVQAKAAD
ncbi:PTS sugar transporter subunit IIB [Agrococcus jejuensis]|uniref:PTS system, ascorbate-specific IIB component n=1 Tax=Agrococcus jejuensis TaxID=399736 RepID=A0A1G8GZ34_9MICO|nr:PTS sugar transporter subunit IIB [Agrococcus jejuensis]SDH99658.1 PTS system, ascorbate-specific IIB component [Agrococcus jejuensis]